MMGATKKDRWKRAVLVNAVGTNTPSGPVRTVHGRRTKMTVNVSLPANVENKWPVIIPIMKERK